ncbi:MAG: TRZ/ATZ family hydrolase [Zoogloea sp.]|uniref:TRZ/ATZ family hydrolase n=1 Tax=Zoogloea sp. TaxID=49181 RepID=UPI00262E160C|nr:TRZ/ATZ family hydrolase [Zoogloea sp.]MDD2988968.1 TRZ/ATZ family hydrolase [Zoogloea sp.]
MTPTPIDLLIEARYIIPVEPYDTTLEHHSIAVRGGRIEAILPTDQARTRFKAAETVSLPEHIITPGLVNLHCHAAMTLMRGLADDLPLMRWLQEAIWPAEARHVSHAFVRDGSLLAGAEMLRGGITTCNDMYFFPQASAEAFDRLGLRAAIGITVIDFPSQYASDADDYLHKGLAAFESWRNHPLISFTLAPHAPYTVSNASFERIGTLADELELPIHIHIHETSREIDDSLRDYGQRPIARLDSLGLLGPGLIGVHGVHLSDDDIEHLALHHCALAHCPTSNMKLASGMAPVTRLLQHGLPVGLGSDGAASNNRLDLWREMLQASLLAKLGTGDASSLPAHEALRMATLHGARALGMDQHIGSVLPGKAADLCALRLDSPDSLPLFDAASHLVYVLGRHDVSDVWISGRQQVKNGELLQISNTELLSIARLWQNKLRQ